MVGSKNLYMMGPRRCYSFKGFATETDTREKSTMYALVDRWKGYSDSENLSEQLRNSAGKESKSCYRKKQWKDIIQTTNSTAYQQQLVSPARRQSEELYCMTESIRPHAKAD